MMRIEFSVVYNALSEVAQHHLCCVLLVTQTSPGTVVEGLHQDVNTKR